MPDPRTPRRGLALGCGGTLGLAWSAVALQAVERQLGWDARDAEVVVGTSAGSELAAVLGSGRPVSALVDALDGSREDPLLADHLVAAPGMLPPLPAPGLPALGFLRGALRGDAGVLAAGAALLPRGRGDAAWLRQLGEALADDSGWVGREGVWLVGASTRDGSRAAFGAPGAPKASLADALAASWGVPGWLPPVEIEGTRYLDGGCVSHASADLLAPLGLDEVVVIAPMATAGGAPARGASRIERLVRRAMTRSVDRDVAALEAAGTRVIRVEPGAEELDAMGANFMDRRRRDATVAAARQHVPDRVARAIATAG
jgi:NTE family protein